jgi:hypothetical protein
MPVQGVADSEAGRVVESHSTLNFQASCTGGSAGCSLRTSSGGLKSAQAAPHRHSTSGVLAAYWKLLNSRQVHSETCGTQSAHVRPLYAAFCGRGRRYTLHDPDSAGDSLASLRPAAERDVQWPSKMMTRKLLPTHPSLEISSAKCQELTDRHNAADVALPRAWS